MEREKAGYASDVVENGGYVLVGIRFRALDRRSEEPQHETAEVKTLGVKQKAWKYLQFTLLLSKLENGSCTNVILKNGNEKQ